MKYKEFIKFSKNVSRETFLLLTQYLTILNKWNSKINLISRQLSNKEIWMNHILDSLSLSSHLNKEESIMDIGSGAGFPGIILAIFGFKKLTLIEINAKKSAFLKTVAATLNLEVQIINTNVQEVNAAPPKVIISKAMASISKLINLCSHLINEDTKIILLKSREQLTELQKLRNDWNYTLQVHDNEYNNSIIVILSNLSRLKKSA